MEEVWKPIEGYEGYYEVSNQGNVRSITRYVDEKRHNGKRIVNGRTLRYGKATHLGNTYYIVMLTKNSVSKGYLVNRLVAEAFLPNPDNLPCVNHKDRKTNNNFVFVNPDGTVDTEKSNLEWCSFQYNSTYDGARERAAEKCRKKVLKISENGEIAETYASRKIAAEMNGTTPPTIGSHIKSGKMWNGFFWEYA